MASPFEILGLPETATPSEIKARWRQLGSKHHPDHGGDPEEFDKYRKAYKKAMETANEPKPCEACKDGKIEINRGWSTINMVCTVCNGEGVVK